MAKKEKKLEMVPASGLALAGNPLFTIISSGMIPAKAKKLNLPPMLKPDMLPVGQMVSGEIVALANSISGRADMRECKLIHLRHESGTEFLIPLTGTIKKAIGGNDGVTNNIGKKLFLVRQPDTTTEKYGGTKKVFVFDVYLE